MAGERYVKVKVIRRVHSISELKKKLPAGEATLAATLKLIDEVNRPIKEKAESVDGWGFIEDFTYIDATEHGLEPGDLVMCPFGPKFIIGLVLGEEDRELDSSVTYKPIAMAVSHVS